MLTSFKFFQISISLYNTFLNYIISYIFKEGLDLGKRKVLNEAALKELVMPHEGEMFGRVIKLVGGDNVIVKCNDGKVQYMSYSG